MFDFVRIVIVAAHLLVVSWAIGGPFIALGLAWRQRRRGDQVAGVAGRRALGTSIVALAAAIVLGIAALVLLWGTGREVYFTAARQVPERRYWFGLVELAFSFVCLAVAWKLWPPPGRAPLAGARFGSCALLTLLAATNLAYHFPPLFVAIGVYGTRPEAWGANLPFTTMLVDPEVASRIVHHLLAAFVVSGALLANMKRPFAQSGLGDDARGRVTVWGGRIALTAGVGQLASGTWLLVEMPAAARERLLGGDFLAGMTFAASLVATLILLHKLAALSLGDAERRQCMAALLFVVLIVLLMVATRQRGDAGEESPPGAGWPPRPTGTGLFRRASGVAATHASQILGQ